MRRALAIAGLALALFAVALWATGGFDALAARAALAQRGFQNALAGALRALKAGETGALATLVAMSFAYGVVHAVGPGHGKFLIGGYGLGSGVGPVRLSAIALASSLAQASVAVALVGLGLAALGWTRDRMVSFADRTLEPLSYSLIALIGLWLGLRGTRHLWQATAGRPSAGHHRHGQPHDHAHADACGHAHGPTVEEIARLGGWRDTAALIAGIAIRPCTGALFVLILTAAMGIPGAGILSAYAMGLGTALVTIGVALASVTMRAGALAALGRSRALALALPAAEILGGGLVLLIALSMLARTA